MNSSNEKWSEDYFQNERKKILATWETGAGVNLEDAYAYHKSMPSSKNAALKVIDARENNKTLLCPSSGSDTIHNHITLLKHLQDEGEADILTSYIDSFTRTGRYEMARKALIKAEESKRPVLNGFPFVVHGVKKSREVMDALELPSLLFGPTPDARLTHEIGLASGQSGYSGGPMISFWNYTKDVPVAEVIHNFQYVNRLMGKYEENGVPILYCVSGAMPAISPPSIMIAPEIIEVLIAAAQGVKHIQLNNWVQGHVVQDLAYIKVFKRLADRYLKRFGFDDVETTTYSVSPTGRFPLEKEKVHSLIAFYTMIGVLGGVQVCGSRTIDEAHHIPTKEGTAESFRNAKMFINMLNPQGVEILNSKAVLEEEYMMEKEVVAILEKVLELGDGDIVKGTIAAVDCGVLDQSYSTSQLVKGKVLGVKDHTGAARFFDVGNLPFDKEILDFHKNKLEQRTKDYGKPLDYETIISDLTAISDGQIV